MANFSIDQLRALPDFARTYKWDMQFLTLPAVGALAFPISEQLNLRCESTELPKSTNQKIEVDIRGHKVRQAGINDYIGTLTLTFTETVDNTIHNFIKAWRELVWETRSGRSFDKAQYTATLKITRLDNQDRAIWDYVLYGCFLEDYDLGSLEGGTPEIMRPSMTLSFDYFVDAPARI
jgi:hypothetical protein